MNQALLITSLFGLACAVVVALSLFARKRERDDAALISAMLLMAWAFSKPMMVLFGWHGAALLFPMTDCIQVIVVMDCWIAAKHRWKLAIVGLLLAKLLMHVMYRVIGAHYGYAYAVSLNVAFAAELIFASWPGGEGLGDRLGRALSRYRAGRRGPVPVARQP